MDNTIISITPSLVIEYLYCPRFIYFMKVMNIKQNEDQRFKVLEGREVHKYKALTNKEYLRKKIGVIEKNQNRNCIQISTRFMGKLMKYYFLTMELLLR